MNKNALFTICIYPNKQSGGIPEEFTFALETFKRYCAKYGLDLIVISERKLSLGYENVKDSAVLEKFQVYDYLDKYDRILRIDIDTLITHTCPNIFDVVPVDDVGVLFEDIGKRKQDRIEQVKLIQSRYGEISSWKDGYFNSGVMVMSKVHKELNKLSADDLKAFINNEVGLLHDQNMFNWKARHLDYKLFSLDYKFNHMFMFDEVNFANIKSGSLFLAKDKSFIVHYAGLRGKMRKRRMTRNYKKIIRAWDQQK